jgi:hypothetical protein
MKGLQTLHNGLQGSLHMLEAECKRAAEEFTLHLLDIDSVECGEKGELSARKKQAAEKIQNNLGQIDTVNSKIVLIKSLLNI